MALILAKEPRSTIHKGARKFTTHYSNKGILSAIDYVVAVLGLDKSAAPFDLHEQSKMQIADDEVAELKPWIVKKLENM